MSRARLVAILIGLGAIVALSVITLQDAGVIALRIVAGALAIGVLPGVLVVLLWRPRESLTLFELLGWGIGVSFGIVQLCTVLMMVLHVGTGTVAAVVAGASAVSAVWIVRSRKWPRIVVPSHQVVIASFLMALSVTLYIQGSPVDSFEDEVHASVVRRLAALDRPAIDNFYFTPNFVYTYPFPGTHVAQALIARVSGIDALFVYHKLRVFWGPAAILLLYTAAAALFGSLTVAAATALTATALAANGTMAAVPGTFWAQVVPYSHPSYVAMDVIFPALLVFCFGYLQSDALRERRFFLTAAAMLVFMLTVVQIREIVQLSVYLFAFALSMLAVGGHRTEARRAGGLLLMSVAIVVLFLSWHRTFVPSVTEIVDDQRVRVVALASSLTIRQLVLSPAPDLLSRFFYGYAPVFHGVNMLAFFAVPLVVAAFRHRPLVWGMAGSMLVYLIVMTVPVAALSYIYASYYEILFMPVRNVIFFLYLTLGGLVYLAAAAVERGRLIPRLTQLTAGTALGGLAVMAAMGLDRSEVGFFVPLMLALVLLFVTGKRSAAEIVSSRGRLAIYACVGALALVPLLTHQRAVPASAAVNVRWAGDPDDGTRAALEARFSLQDGQPTPDRTTGINVWQYRLRDLSRQNVQALVNDAAVADTQNIDRRTFQVASQPPATDHPIPMVELIQVFQYPSLPVLMCTAVLFWVLAFGAPLAVASYWSPVADRAIRRPLVSFMVVLLPFAAMTAIPSLSSTSLTPTRPFGLVSTPAQMLDSLPCINRVSMAAPFTEEDFSGMPLVLSDVTSCAPSRGVIEFVQTHVAVNAVLAISRWNEYLPSMFVPQQVVVFPGFERAFADEQQMFGAYYRLYHDSVRKHRTQPFFNVVETPEDRAAFLKALGVTHVLVDPAHYQQMRSTLDALPGLLERRYEDGKWALYEVVQAPL